MTLPSVLSALVKQQRLAPELAVGLDFLDPFSARWDWRAPAFARPIMKALEPAYRTSFANEWVLELDRSDTNFAGNENLESYQKLIADTLPAAAPAACVSSSGSPSKNRGTTTRRMTVPLDLRQPRRLGQQIAIERKIAVLEDRRDVNTRGVFASEETVHAGCRAG